MLHGRAAAEPPAAPNSRWWWEKTGDRPIRVGIGDELGLKKRLAAVQDCRSVKKGDMIHDDRLPDMEIDPQTYAVRADGQLPTYEPAKVLPMTQQYFLF